MSNKNPCSCIRDTFCLHVSIPAKDVVLIHDLSNWVTDEDQFVYPDFYFLNVKHPNGQTISTEVSPKNGFILSENKLEDGIYEFSLDNCGVLYTQKELILSNIQCSLDIAVVKSEKKRDFELISDIKDDMLVAKAAAGLGNYENAKKILETIKQKINNLSCDCKCK